MLLAQRTLTAVQEARPLTDSSPHLILLTQANDKDPNKERCGVFSTDCTTGTRRPEEAIFDNKLEVFWKCLPNSEFWYFSVLPQLSCYQLWVPKVQLKMSENDFLPHENGGGGGREGGRKKTKRRKMKNSNYNWKMKREKEIKGEEGKGTGLVLLFNDCATGWSVYWRGQWGKSHRSDVE